MEIDKVRRRWDVSFDRMKDRAINLKEDNARIKDEAFAKDTALDIQKRKIILLNEQIAKMKQEKTVVTHLGDALKYLIPAGVLAGVLANWIGQKYGVEGELLLKLTAFIEGLLIAINLGIVFVYQIILTKKRKK